MVVGKSPEWLPPGFTEKVKYKNGRKIKYYYNVATGKKYYSQKDLIRGTENFGCLSTPQKEIIDDNGLNSGENVDSVSVRSNDPLQELPEGWILEEKTRQSGSRKGSIYKVYTNLLSGRKFYSMAAVTQYLNTLDHANTVAVQNEGVVDCASADNILVCTPQTINGGDSGLSSDKRVDAIVVEGNNSPQWLPEGWTMEERIRQSGSRRGTTYKIYIDSSSGRRFYSRTAVTEYLNTVGHARTMPVQNEDVIGCGTTDNQLLGTPQTPNGNESALSTDKNVDAASLKTNDSAQWLTEGWRVEEKTRQSGSSKGSSYKVYTDLSSGMKFYSRAAVTRYLNTVNNANSTTVPKNIDNSDESCHISRQKKQRNFKMITSEITAADDLPPGWIKEIRISKSGNRIRRDPFYTDPISGYVFRSKLDALRYVETNNIGSCACKPFKREPDDLKLIKNDIQSLKPGDEKSCKQKRQLFLEEESHGGETSSMKTNAKSMTKISKQGNDVSDYEERTSSENAAICSLVTDPLSTESQFSASGVGKAKKRRAFELSQRLSGIRSNLEPSCDEMNTSSLNVSAGIPPTPDIELANVTEKPHMEKPENQTGGKASEKQPNDGKKSPESQIGCDFWDSWSDPIEFTLKTLCGEIPVEDNLPFSGSLDVGLNTPFHQPGEISKVSDGCSKPLQSDEPVIFKNEIIHRAEPVKQHGALALLQSNPALFSTPGNASFSASTSFNGQSSTEGGKRDCHTNSNLLEAKQTKSGSSG